MVENPCQPKAASKLAARGVPALRYRQLRAGEEERFLDFLDLWPFADARRGRDFFRRYLEKDPSYAPENVWICEHERELVAGLQIFPRWIRIGWERVPTGGVGSVLTASPFRRRGLATELLRLAVEDMVARGMELSMLWASRHDWYEAQGWNTWGGEMYDLVGEEGTPLLSGRGSSGLRHPDLEILRFEMVHLEFVWELGSVYSELRSGTVWRDHEAWRASLHLAGDPLEEFLLVFRAGESRPCAYLRGGLRNGRWCAFEWAREGDAVSELALLLATVRSALGLPSLRLPRLGDDELARGLRAHRLDLMPVEEAEIAGERPPRWMLRCIRPDALARRFDVASGSSPEGLLERVFPKQEFHFWPADRF